MMVTPDGWTRSSFSGSAGNCIELKADGYGRFLLIRESDNGPSARSVRVSDFDAWRADVEAGRYVPARLVGDKMLVSIPRGQSQAYLDSPTVDFMSTQVNWAAFVLGLRAGDFDRVIEEARETAPPVPSW